MPVRASSKKVAHSAPEIVFTLFGFHSEFVSFQTLSPRAIRHYAALAGFSAASFEGGRKSGGERGRLLNCGPALTKSDAVPAKKGNPYGSD